MSVEARKWAGAFGLLGWDVRWIADGVLPGLGIGATVGVEVDEVLRAVDGCDVVVVDNLLSLPLNPEALRAVADALRGRASIVKHYDLPWQRDRFAGWPLPPDDPAWAHVTINELSRLQLREHGIEAVTMYNRFPRFEPTGAAGVEAPRRPLVLQPTRAIERKNVPAGVALAERLRGTYWLVGPAEDGYSSTLDRVLGAARCPVRRGMPASDSIDDAYSACDVVVLPSTWEGFGNPSIESAFARRPLAIGDYLVARELRTRFGFKWFSPSTFTMADVSGAVIDHNEAIAAEHFSIDRLPGEIASVLERVL